MDSTLLMVKCISLLFLESKINQSSNSNDFCKKIIESLKIEESSIELSSNGEVILSLRSLLFWIMAQVEKKTLDRKQLLQRLKVATRDNVYIYEAIQQGIDIEDEDEIKREVIQNRSQLREHINSLEVKETIKEAYKKINLSSQDDYRLALRDVYSKLEPYTHGLMDEKHPAIVDSINFSDSDEMAEFMNRSKEEISTDGILRTGYHAINRMTGEQEGFRRGEFVLIGALQHNFKTGFALNLFKHFALYNKPYMRDKEKKPLLLHISLENELHLNIMQLYSNLKENETGVPVDLDSVDTKQAATYVREKMGENGYHIEMFRLDPNQTSYHELIDILLKYESDGYEIHAVVCDYLNMVNRNGLNNGGPAGTEIRQLFRLVRNYAATRGITFVTPHQLSTEAKMLVRQGVENFVQEIANKGYYDGSKQIDQEVDLEFFIHIEKVKGAGSFLTVARGKHRKISITPEKDLYTVLPFHPVGGILDDVEGEDLSLKSVGSRKVDGENKEWWE